MIPLQKHIFILIETVETVNRNFPKLICTQINLGVILMFLLGITPQFIVVISLCIKNTLTVLTVFISDFPPFCRGIINNINKGENYAG